MLFLDVMTTCNSASLSALLVIVKRVLTIIQILVPIILIVSCIISFTELVANPDQKGGTKKILNKFLAAVIIFFIPVLMNAVMGLLGESSEFSNCWNTAGNTYVPANGSVEEEDNAKPFIPSSKDYQK